jgi:hypothetical protein
MQRVLLLEVRELCLPLQPLVHLEPRWPPAAGSVAMRERAIRGKATPLDAPPAMAYVCGDVADKFEREIEEILAKLDDKLPEGGTGERAPISLASKRQQRAKAQKARTPRPNPFSTITPTHLLFAGAGIMFGGLLLSNVWDPLIWASLSGIILFLGAFAWSFRRTNRSGGNATRPAGGYYWRDRYIQYGDGEQKPGIKGWFRKR